jgi:alanine-glyoxylate transaminase/serine-glyoxylate transaminase/serine-pyruvate transaminase
MLVADGVASPAVTAVRALAGMDVHDYLEWLLREHRIRIGGGLGEHAGRIFRVGHMGRAAEPAASDRFLAATADYVERRGLGAPAARRGAAG